MRKTNEALQAKVLVLVWFFFPVFVTQEQVKENDLSE